MDGLSLPCSLTPGAEGFTSFCNLLPCVGVIELNHERCASSREEGVHPASDPVWVSPF